MTNEQGRAAFEAWIQTDPNYDHDLKQDPSGNYLHDATDMAWGAWQARAEQPTDVPKEAIGKMLTHLMDIAVANGANSVSMPDEYVAVAAWLSDIKPGADVLVDAERWRMLPAFLEEFQIEYVPLLHAIDAARAKESS